ncbi:YbaY family lipoprotein [Litchfieldella qijiaojingensis]|nr:YbaY family lipoprotein [Halomonas qijiaojingensis]
MLRSLPLLAMLVLLGACASGPRFATLDARVVPTTPLELPADAELRVTLEDVSQATVIAESIYTRLDAGPYDVALRYDANAIDDDHAYVLRAQVRADGRSTHVSPEPVPVLTGDVPPGVIEIPLETMNH